MIFLIRLLSNRPGRLHRLMRIVLFVLLATNQRGGSGNEARASLSGRWTLTRRDNDCAGIARQSPKWFKSPRFGHFKHGFIDSCSANRATFGVSADRVPILARLSRRHSLVVMT